MKNIKHSFSIIILLFTFNSCGIFNRKTNDLGNDYSFNYDKCIVPINLFTKTAIYQKIVKYDYNDKFIIVKQKPNKSKFKKMISEDLLTRCMIYEGYLKERNDKDYEKITTPYIIESIKADSLLYFRLKKNGLKNDYEKNDIKLINTATDSIIENNNYYKKIFSSNVNYWIIDKIQNIRFGPFDKIEFENELKEMKIQLTIE